MARVFALSDLHLSLNGEKPMDRFGAIWQRHAERMAQAWDANVSESDTVLLGGDLSWGRNLEEASPDLRWIADRPGRKLLLRGNHDSWWSSLAKLRRTVPGNWELLQNCALRAGPWIVIGARGWLDPEDPLAQASDARVFQRELGRLDLSIADADRRYGSDLPRLALLHYPPWLLGRQPTEVVQRLKEAAVEICIYGHLHGEDHKLAVRGLRDGIEYVFTASDAVNFSPVEIRAPGEDAAVVEDE